jgi:2-C-methyl-D-erythritol 4-phosphate cytidylyltransferase
MLEKKVSVILLAGGKGARFGASCPKQFLQFKNKYLFEHSLEIFNFIEGIFEIIIVVEESFRHLFSPNCKFALPGKERQDSVYNGLQEVDASSEFVLIHDSARPLVKKEDIIDVLLDAFTYGAAALAVPLKFTVKSTKDSLFVDKTIERSTLFEIQTPQVIKKELLIEGFKEIKSKNLLVTDDVSIVEQLNLQVKLTIGSYSNIKITTPEDLKQAYYLSDEEL